MSAQENESETSLVFQQ